MHRNLRHVHFRSIYSLPFITLATTACCRSYSPNTLIRSYSVKCGVFDLRRDEATNQPVVRPSPSSVPASSLARIDLFELLGSFTYRLTRIGVGPFLRFGTMSCTGPGLRPFVPGCRFAEPLIRVIWVIWVFWVIILSGSCVRIACTHAHICPGGGVVRHRAPEHRLHRLAGQDARGRRAHNRPRGPHRPHGPTPDSCKTRCLQVASLPHCAALERHAAKRGVHKV
jgi:hypothetical protein